MRIQIFRWEVTDHVRESDEAVASGANVQPAIMMGRVLQEILAHRYLFDYAPALLLMSCDLH